MECHNISEQPESQDREQLIVYTMEMLRDFKEQDRAGGNYFNSILLTPSLPWYLLLCGHTK